MKDALEDTTRTGTVPGSDGEFNNNPLRGFITYLIGFLLSCILTIASFYLVKSHLLWPPSIPVALTVLAVAQIGVHLTFFLHLTTGSDNVNNSLALAFGTLVVALVIGGALWIMNNMNQHMPHMTSDFSERHPDIKTPALVDHRHEMQVISQYSEVTGTVVAIYCNTGVKVYQGKECATIEVLTPNTRSQKHDIEKDSLKKKIFSSEKKLTSLENRILSAPPTNQHIKAKLRKEYDVTKIQLSEWYLILNSLTVVNNNEISKKSLFQVISPVNGFVTESNIHVGDKLTPTSSTPIFRFKSCLNCE